MLTPSSAEKRRSVGAPHHLLPDHHTTPSPPLQSPGLETRIFHLPCKPQLDTSSKNTPFIIYLSNSQIYCLSPKLWIPPVFQDPTWPSYALFLVTSQSSSRTNFTQTVSLPASCMSSYCFHNLPQSFSFSVSSNPPESFKSQASPPSRQPF